ncbi:MAG: hypothetical protein PVI37_02940 [Gammaproteobacteria bacterium]|jgi:hypothetical protein
MANDSNLARLAEDQKRGNLVHGHFSHELLQVLNGMRSTVAELRRADPELASRLREPALLYRRLYAAPYDMICDIRSKLLKRYAQTYADLRPLAESDIEPEELARQALGDLAGEILAALRCLEEGLTELRERESELGEELRRGGRVHDRLYGVPYTRLAQIRDSIPIVVNGIYARLIV